MANVQTRMKSAIGLVVMVITIPLVISVTASVSADPNAPPLAVTAVDFIPVVYVLGILWLAADVALGESGPSGYVAHARRGGGYGRR